MTEDSRSPDIADLIKAPLRTMSDADAIELWDGALDILPNFAMARGGRGSGFKFYGLVSEDGYDREIPLLTAHDAFASATAEGVLWDSDYPPSVEAYFKTQARHIEDRLDLAAIAADLHLDGPGLGRSKAEQAYRRWWASRPQVRPGGTRL